MAMIMLRLPGFASPEAAMARSREIAQASGFQSPNVYWFRWVQHSSTEWALELSPEEQGKLTDDERKRIIALSVVPIQAHPTPVYRYMDAEFVEQFFSSGTLRLSSFEAFSRHPDELLRDAHEGKNILTALGENSTMYVVSEHGKACLIISASYLGPWSASKLSHRRTCFEITNPWGFAAAIAAAINGCSAAVLGACSYVPTLSMTLHAPGYNFVRAHGEGGLEGLQKDAAAMLQYSPMFRKLSRYQDEQEFRFVWGMDRQVSEPLTIVCPAARQFCRKLEPSDYDVGSVWGPGINLRERTRRVISRIEGLWFRLSKESLIK
jgi:hypothetical protein